MPHAGRIPLSIRAGGARGNVRRTPVSAGSVRRHAFQIPNPSAESTANRASISRQSSIPFVCCCTSPWVSHCQASTARVGGFPGPRMMATSTTERDQASTASIVAPSAGAISGITSQHSRWSRPYPRVCNTTFWRASRVSGNTAYIAHSTKALSLTARVSPSPIP